jgi:hypothetical protein
MCHSPSFTASTTGFGLAPAFFAAALRRFEAFEVVTRLGLLASEAFEAATFTLREERGIGIKWQWREKTSIPNCRFDSNWRFRWVCWLPIQHGAGPA